MFDTTGSPFKKGFDHFFGYNCQRHAHSYFPTYLYDDDKRVIGVRTGDKGIDKDGNRKPNFEPGIDISLVENLVPRPLPEHAMYFGGVQAAARHPDGRLVGAADPRRTGAVRVGGAE